jgi:hypothetical protein
MNKNSKQRLFEVMGKLDPDFNINEDVPEDANTDVEIVNNLKTPAQKDAYKRINFREEFKDAFEAWFGDLGVANKYKNRINITTTLEDIRDVLNKYGVKI